MKKFLISLLSLIIAVTASAVPAKRGFVAMQQSDGTTITIDMVGDEFHHSFITLDNRTVARDERGDFYYLTPNGISTVMAHDPARRNAAEQAFVEANKESLTLNALLTSDRQARRTRANVLRRATQVPNNGSPRIPIILVNYKDIKFKADDPVAQFNEQFNEKDISCYNYFVDQSRGKFTPQFDIHGVVQLSSNRATYGGNNYLGDDKGIGKMVAEAVDSLKSTVDFSVYDNDGDGEVDVVIILYAGVGEAQAYRIVPNAIWPCQWQLDESDYGTTMTVDGKKINKFACFNELYGSSDYNTRIDGIGTFCHEFSHCLGLPDFYDTNYGGHYGMGNWSLLDSGCYANDGDTPVGYDAYERSFMGWLDLLTPEENTHYELDPLNTDTGEAYIIVNEANRNEYFLLENRKKTDWDTYLPGEGLLITHVDFNQSIWDNNTPNNGTPQRMTIMPADGTLNSVTEAGDTYPYGENNSFTDTSTPAAKFNTGNFASKPVTDITRHDNGQISFEFMKMPFEKIVPQLTDTTVADNQITAHWTPVDSVKEYTLRVINLNVKPQYELVLDEKFTNAAFRLEGSTDISKDLNKYLDTKGWTGSYLYTAKGGIRIGRAASTGMLISPEFDVTSSSPKLTVIFRAQTYNTDTNCQITIENEYDQQVVTIPDNNAALYAVVLETDSVQAQQVTIRTNTRARRVVISSIELYSGDASSLVSAAPRRTPVEDGNEFQRIISGITDTTYTVTGLAPGSYEINVRATYVDDSNSRWSDTWLVNLGGDTPAISGDINNDGSVDVSDLNILINIILGFEEADKYNGRANIDGIGSIDTGDINALINIMLSSE